MIDPASLPESVAAIEARRLAAGEPTAAVRLAGMQYHAYGRDDGLEGIVSPCRGDRLQLVREPENPADENAVGVWWRNEHRIGHLPRRIAADVAPGMDEGERLRAYLYEEGDGSPWSAEVFLIGTAVERIHAADRAWQAKEDADRRARFAEAGFDVDDFY